MFQWFAPRIKEELGKIDAEGKWRVLANNRRDVAVWRG